MNFLIIKNVTEPFHHEDIFRFVMIVSLDLDNFTKAYQVLVKQTAC